MPVAVCAAVCVYWMSMRPQEKKTNRHEWSESEKPAAEEVAHSSTLGG